MTITTGSVEPLLKGRRKMPKVGKKHFPYTKEGKADAKKAAKEEKKDGKKKGRFGTEI